MSMEITLALDKPGYYPGDILRCAIKVDHTDDSCEGQGHLTLTAEASGTERQDPGWVVPSYRPGTAAVKDGKRLTRPVFASGHLPLLTDVLEVAGFSRTFLLRLRLPTRIPPSYRGNAVSFQYHLSVHGSFTPSGTPAAAGAAAAPVRVEALLPFQVWPRGERPAPADRRTSAASVVAAAAAAAAAPAAGARPAAAAAAAGAGLRPAGGGEEEADLELVEYLVGVKELKHRAEELVLLQPGGTLAGMASGTLAGLAPLSPTCSLLPMGSLPLSGDPQGALVTDSGDTGDPEGGMVMPASLRQLTPLQRAHLLPRTYNLQAGDHPLVRIMVQTCTDQLLQPGGTVSVMLDFRAAHGPLAAAAAAADTGGQQQQQQDQRPRCLQVTALLESQEVIHAPYTHHKGQDTPSMRKLYSEQQSITACLLTSQFIFSIPPHAPVSFRTPVVSHRWVLRFELSVQYPRSKRPEQLLWNLPVVVFPPPQSAAC